MPARERSGDKGGVGIFSYDLMASMVRWYLKKWWDAFVLIYTFECCLKKCIEKSFKNFE